MWITNNPGKSPAKNNKGMSLVELLVAIAVAAVIMTGLSYMLISTLNLYARTGAGVDAQNEAQTAMNMVIDRIMRADGVLLVEQEPSALATSELTLAMFGEITKSADAVSFDGDAIFWDPARKELYLLSGNYALGTVSEEAQVPLKAYEEMKSLLPADAEERKRYLMAQHISSFSILTDGAVFVEPTPEPDATEEEIRRIKNYFENPLRFQVDMTVEIDYQNNRKTSRQLDDSAVVRNRLTEVYIQRLGKSGIVKYVRNPR